LAQQPAATTLEQDDDPRAGVIGRHQRFGPPAAVRSGLRAFVRLAVACSLAASLAAQSRDNPASQTRDYVVGAQDVLTITLWDQADLSGKFSVDTDGTFTFPLVGRIKAGGLTLRDVEADLKKRLADGYFKNPQLSVSVESYRSQRVFVVGEVRTPGSFPLTGEITLIEVLARAGSTTLAASGEALIVRPAGRTPAGPVLPSQAGASDLVRVDLNDLQRGVAASNIILRDGDTVFVPRAENVYVFGQVKNPGAYPIQKDTSVLQALSLAGGVTDRGSTSRLRLIRVVDGNKTEMKAKLTTVVQAGDTIVVLERFF
jgi:polysaccharide biosynthesis/export protein